MAWVTAILPWQHLRRWVGGIWALDHPVLLGIFWPGNGCWGGMRGDAGVCQGAARGAGGRHGALLKSALGRKVVRQAGS